MKCGGVFAYEMWWSVCGLAKYIVVSCIWFIYGFGNPWFVSVLMYCWSSAMYSVCSKSLEYSAKWESKCGTPNINRS